MIESVCCRCGVVYGTKEDGREAVMQSHGYCPTHFAVELEAIRAIPRKEERYEAAYLNRPAVRLSGDSRVFHRPTVE